MSASVMGFDFDESYRKADIIAQIEIIECLGEVYSILGAHTGVFKVVNYYGHEYIIKMLGNCPELSEAIAAADNR